MLKMQRNHLKILLLVLVGLSVPLLIGWAAIEPYLRGPATPSGIISFEFCGFTSSCEAALAQWGIKGQQLFMLALGLDYLFLLLYPSVICIGLLLVAAKVPPRLKFITSLLAWIALSAGMADAVENFFLIRVVLSGSDESSAVTAGVFAGIKFAVLAPTILWLLLASALYGFRLPNKSVRDFPSTLHD